MIKEEALEFLKSTIQEMNTQDNRCTATPYYYQIQDFEYIPTADYLEYDRVVVVSDHDRDITYKIDEESLIEFYRGILISNNIEFEDQLWTGSTDEYVQILQEHDFWTSFEKKTEVLKGFFLTESEAKQHLESNSYHYSPNARTYVSHAWRAPVFQKFLEAVGTICDVEYQKK